MENQRPNILTIFVDQLSRHVLGCYGDTHGATPHIDALAARGTRFANSCTTFPVCVPQRWSMMTGRYAHSEDVPGIGYAMSHNERTLADALNDRGYETAWVGKWHLSGGHGAAYLKQPVAREDQGRWQVWRGFELRNSHFDTVYFKDADPTPHPIDGYQTDGLTDVALDYVLKERDKTKPFCCVLSVEPPHPPVEAPAELEAKWLARDLDLPPNFMVPGDDDDEATVEWSLPFREDEREAALRWRKIYYAMVENLDQNVGRIIEALEQNGLAENTIVMLMADHGELIGAHRLKQKASPYDESTGVPLIIAGPGIAKSSVVTDPTCTEDLFPTFLGLTGEPNELPGPGVDLSPLMRGEKASLAREGVLLEHVREHREGVSFHRRSWRAWRTDRYKYTVFGERSGMAPWQLFDLQADPYELNNLVDDPAHQTVRAQMHDALRARMAETQDLAVLV